MKHLCLILSAIIVCIASNGQTPLPESRRSSAEIFVYKLGRDDMRALFLKEKSLGEEMLHTFVMSCTDVKDIPPLPRGNYITVRVVGSQLQYSGHTVDNFCYNIVKDKKVILMLTDTLGNVIGDAAVKRGLMKMRFDKRTDTYNIRRVGDEKLVEVDNRGVMHYIEFDKIGYYNHTYFNSPRSMWWRFKDSFRSLGRVRPNKTYEGFVVFSKPKYKPGETVKFKAYMHHDGKPYNEDVDVALTAYYPHPIDTVLTKLSPYRPGMFEWQFRLSDSLKLMIDCGYNVKLRPKGRTNGISGGFSYEDYELARITFTPEAEKERYARGDTVRIAVKAEDENGMPVFDGRVEVNIYSSTAYPKKYLTDSAFIPYLIWEHTFDMEQMPEKKLTLPDSLFLKDVSMPYRIECIFTDAGNERHSNNVSIYYDARERVVDFSIEKGMMTVRELAGGESVETAALLTAYTSGDEVARREEISLPCTFPLVWHASKYKVETATASGDYSIGDTDSDIMGHRFFRDGGNIRLTVDNPAGIPFWYSVKKGDRVIDKGYAPELDYTRKAAEKSAYSMQIAYILGNDVKLLSGGLPYYRKNISMDVSTPTTVWPGQNANVEVAVKNKKGRPVKNADVTAYAWTSKFGDKTPDVKIYGKMKSAKGFQNTNYRVDEDGLHNAKARMDWNIWRERMGLDSIEYYRFLYPGGIYTYSEPAPGLATQISPYVVLNGEVLGVNILWIDEKPWYFHQAEQYRVYSFPVSPGYHTIKMRTWNREVTVKNVFVEAGTRHILSVDCSAPSSNDAGDGRKPVDIAVTEYGKDQRGKLTDREMTLLKEHMITVDNNFGSITLGSGYTLSPPAVLSTSAGYYYLNHSTKQGAYDYNARRYREIPILAGPFPYNGMATLYAGDDLVRNFQIEGGYNYSVWKNYIKQSGWGVNPIKNRIDWYTPVPSFKSAAPTPASINRLYNEKVLAALTGGSEFLMGMNRSKDDNCKLYIELPSLKNAAPADEPAMIHIESGSGKERSFNTFSGSSRSFYDLPEGPAEVSLIFSDSTRCTAMANLRKDGENYLRIDSVRRLPADSLARAVFAEFGRHMIPIRPDDPLAAFDIPAKTDSAAVNRTVPVTGVFDMSNYEGERVTGTIRDADGNPLLGASVLIEGSNTGTITDADGRFALPYSGPGRFTAMYLGYESATMGLISGYDYDIVLKESVTSIDDIVVVAYGIEQRTTRMIDASETEKVVMFDLLPTPPTISSALAGLIPGVMVRGAASIPAAAEAPPLILVDGVPYDGDLQELLDIYGVESMSVLKDASTSGIYGSRGANGVIMITTTKGIPGTVQMSEEDLLFATGSGAGSIRADFSDDAFWKPVLTTDSEGRLSFEVKYPDDITNWTANFIAVGGRKKTDRAQVKVKSFKPLNAQLSVPSFMTAGDSLDVIGRLTNHLGDSLTVSRTIDVDGTLSRKEIGFGNSHIDRIPVEAAATLDSIRVEYTLETASGYLDGERRYIPVIRQGVPETHGQFAVLNDTLPHMFATDPALGMVTFHAESSAMNVFLEEIAKVDSYPYMCNEQMASKIKALISQKRICRLTGVDFNGDRKINNLIGKLNRNRNGEKLWGWWNRDKTELWISRQIIEAILEAEKEGFKTDFDRQATIDALIRELDRPEPAEQKVKSDLLDILVLLHRLGSDIDYARYYSQISPLPDASLNGKLRTAETALALGLEPKTDTAQIMAAASRTLLGSTYWEEPRKKGAEPLRLWLPNSGSVENTLTAYRILRMSGAGESELAAIRNYFFELRKTGSWQNTYESSRILETILPDMLAGGETAGDGAVTVNGRTFGEFPVTETFEAGTEITVGKSGIAPVFMTVYQRGWNEKPETRSDGFTVKTRVEKDGATLSELKAGEAVNLKVSVDADSDAEYVMIEVPVPAGCSFVSKDTGGFRTETHREYYKERVVIFCTRLAKGGHEFTIELNPRYSGSVHQNPARAELMYFPTVFGRTAVRNYNID